MRNPELTCQSLALLNAYQHEFPLLARPFEVIARDLGRCEDDVLDTLAGLREQRVLARVGAVWDRAAGGAGALCAMRVPPQQVERVAAMVNAQREVNHNYLRDHAWNLWYVISAGDAGQVRAAARRIEEAAQAQALFLPMVRQYRIDLGFDLVDPLAAPAARPPDGGPPVDAADRPLAALAERGLALVPRPFDVWAAALGCETHAILERIRGWKEAGTLRRFGVVVRHHELGIAANAMTVVNAPADRADAIGAVLAQQPGVTLAYRRETDARWPYNLYFMVHGRERAAVQALVDCVLAGAGVAGLPHETLFSIQRFKQTGSGYFSEAVPA